jgi:hypothetical protein
MLLLLSALLVLSPNARASDEIGDMPVDSVRASLGINIPDALLRDGIYKSSVDLPITPKGFETMGESELNTEQQGFLIHKGEPFAVRIVGDEVYLMPIVAQEAHGVIPDTFLFDRSAFFGLAGELTFVMEGDQYALYKNFSEDEEVEIAAGQCKALVEKHMGFWVPGKCASSMNAEKLSRVGFHPAACGSAQLQVWGGGGKGGCGHVAFRRADGIWSSVDYVGDPGHKFYSIGCYSRSGAASPGYSFPKKPAAPKKAAPKKKRRRRR